MDWYPQQLFTALQACRRFFLLFSHYIFSTGVGLFLLTLWHVHAMVFVMSSTSFSFFYFYLVFSNIRRGRRLRRRLRLSTYGAAYVPTYYTVLRTIRSKKGQ